MRKAGDMTRMAWSLSTIAISKASVSLMGMLTSNKKERAHKRIPEILVADNLG